MILPGFSRDSDTTKHNFPWSEIPCGVIDFSGMDVQLTSADKDIIRISRHCNLKGKMYFFLGIP